MEKNEEVTKKLKNYPEVFYEVSNFVFLEAFLSSLEKIGSEYF
jgi:hypothetical protein